jgi:tetratricopeptide (TPR) repeat protein
MLAKRVPEGVRYVGVGVGKRWARGLMKAAAERSGGYFTQINPDEPVAWRAFDLFAALNTPRLLDVKVVDAAERATFLCPTSALAQGEELCAVARVGPGEPVPEAVVISGTLGGRPFRKEVPVRDVAGGAGYLPRTWAKWEIERLLVEDAAANRDRIIALSKAMYVMTPYTSLLVLENEAMYAQYKVDRGRKDHWAMYSCPPTIPVVREPLHTAVPSTGGGGAGDKRPGVDEVLASVLMRVPPPILTGPGGPPDDGAGRSVVTALDTYRRDLSGGIGAERKPEGRPTAEGGGSYETHTARGLLKYGLMRPELYRNEKELRLLEEFATKTMTEQTQSSSIRPPGADPKTANVPYLNPYYSGTFPDPNFFYGMRGPRPVNPFANVPDAQTATAPPPRPVTTIAPTGMPVQGGGTSFPASGTTAFGGGFGGYSYVPPGFNSFGGQFGGGIGGFGGGLGFGGPAGFGGFNGAFTAGFNGVVPGTSGPVGFNRFPTGTGGMSTSGTSMPASPPRTEPPSDPTAAKPVPPAPPVEAPAPVLPQVGGALPAPPPGDSMPSLGVRYTVPMRGKAKITDMGFPRARETEHEQLFSIWPGFFGDTLAKSMKGQEGQTQGTDALRNWLYHRPTFSGDPRVFRDLVAYAPAMNTQPADILAVIETEAASAPAAGQVAPAARALIDQARAAGWQALTLPGADGFRLVCDGSGRYAWDRVLPVGLREQMVCDGKTLLHLYPEIGLGARRAVSRFHRAELAELVPWFVPPAEDLTRGADLICADERTVAVVPHGADQARAADGKPLPYLRTHLVFAGGRLAERRLVEMPSARVVAAETYAPDGTVRLLDDAGKEVAVRRLKTEPAAAPGLRPDLRDLVVLPLPLRTPQHVAAAKHLPPNGNYAALDEETALALVGALFAVNSKELSQVVSQRYLARGDQRLGFHVLLTAAGLDADPLALPKNRSHQPLARYLAGLRRGTPDGKLARTEAAGNAFLQRLVALHDLHRLGSQPKGSSEGTAPGPLERKMALESLRTGKASSLDWALLSLAQERLGEDEEMEKAIGNGLRKLADVPDLSYIADYERARLSLTNGRQQEAREIYQELYARALKSGVPPIDPSFRAAFQTANKEAGADAWAGWVRQTAARLVEQDQRLSVFTLARQCYEFGDVALAGQLLDLALDGADRSAERVPVTLAAVAFLAQTGQYARADELLRPLLADRELADSAGLWRLGAWLAGQRRQAARAFTCLERALDIEYRQAAGTIDLQALRSDYGSLLSHYEQLAGAFATLRQPPPAEFVPRVVRAADRWRSLDPDDTAACQAAARVFKAVGATDLAWDYLTTAPSPGDGPAPWLNLAQSLHAEGQLELAGRAYALAFEAEPTNPQPLWSRARVLEEEGKSAEARQLIRRIAEGEWPAQFGELKTQARQQAASQMTQPAGTGR